MIRLMFATILAASIVCVGCGDDADDATEPGRISVAELKEMLDNEDDIVVVDTRSRGQYDAGHIPEAISMDYPAAIEARYGELPNDKTIILYCS